MKKHLVVSIAGLERKIESLKTNYARNKYCFDLLGVSHNALKIELEEMKVKGFTVIPGNNCEHNPDGTCPGHE